MTQETEEVRQPMEMFDNKPLPEAEGVEFRSDATVVLRRNMGTEKDIIETARVSTEGSESFDTEIFNQLDESDEGLIRYLYKHKHGTPFESCVMRFYFEFPIFTSRQVVKHRLSSINEESGRYRELQSVFYEVPEERKLVQVGKTGAYKFELGSADQLYAVRWVQRSTAISSWENYQMLLQMGIAKEVARQHLPFHLYSSMYFTANLRSVLNFLSLRKDWGKDATHASKAQYEISLVADGIAEVVKERYPTVWQCFVDNGYEAV